MKKRMRRCDSRCHNSQGKRCACVCGGCYHGAAGIVNREALHQATDDQKQKLLEEQGFRPGEAAYIEQTKLPL